MTYKKRYGFITCKVNQITAYSIDGIKNNGEAVCFLLKRPMEETMKNSFVEIMRSGGEITIKCRAESPPDLYWYSGYSSARISNFIKQAKTRRLMAEAEMQTLISPMNIVKGRGRNKMAISGNGRVDLTKTNNSRVAVVLDRSVDRKKEFTDKKRSIEIKKEQRAKEMLLRKLRRIHFESREWDMLDSKDKSDVAWDRFLLRNHANIDESLGQEPEWELA